MKSSSADTNCRYSGFAAVTLGLENILKMLVICTLGNVPMLLVNAPTFLTTVTKQEISDIRSELAVMKLCVKVISRSERVSTPLGTSKPRSLGYSSLRDMQKLRTTLAITAAEMQQEEGTHLHDTDLLRVFVMSPHKVEQTLEKLCSVGFPADMCFELRVQLYKLPQQQ